jgi:transcriptional regulator with XRE-family HTH domain
MGGRKKSLTGKYRMRYIRIGVATGRIIRQLREDRRLTQADLAKQADVARITLLRIEGGSQDPTLSTLARLARALRVSVRDLLPPEKGT